LLQRRGGCQGDLAVAAVEADRACIIAAAEFQDGAKSESDRAAFAKGAHSVLRGA
jgi:hypothetical protein